MHTYIYIPTHLDTCIHTFTCSYMEYNKEAAECWAAEIRFACEEATDVAIYWPGPAVCPHGWIGKCDDDVNTCSLEIADT